MRNYKLLTIAALLSPLSAYAADNFYVSTTGEYIASASSSGSVSVSGQSFPGSVDFDNGYGGLISIGKQMGDFRAELEAGYRDIKEKSVSVTIAGTTYTSTSNQHDKAITGMANILYDIPTGTSLTPYIGAGIGEAHLTNNGGSNAFAYQGMLGVNYKVSQAGTIFAGYRYFVTKDFTINQNISGIPVTEKADIKANTIDIGYRYSF